MQRVYIETSIVGYLRQRSSPQIVAAARQLLTRRWWDSERGKYDLVTSQYVIDEASRGDVSLARERLVSLAGIRRLELKGGISELVEELMSQRILPRKAEMDALHLATWNCAHLANGQVRQRIRALFSDSGLWTPVICTPEELIDYDANR